VGGGGGGAGTGRVRGYKVGHVSFLAGGSDNVFVKALLIVLHLDVERVCKLEKKFWLFIIIIIIIIISFFSFWND
jgi:hypothetical protein